MHEEPCDAAPTSSDHRQAGDATVRSGLHEPARTPRPMPTEPDPQLTPESVDEALEWTRGES